MWQISGYKACLYVTMFCLPCVISMSLISDVDSCTGDRCIDLSTTEQAQLKWVKAR